MPRLSLASRADGDRQRRVQPRPGSGGTLQGPDQQRGGHCGRRQDPGRRRCRVHSTKLARLVGAAGVGTIRLGDSEYVRSAASCRSAGRGASGGDARPPPPDGADSSLAHRPSSLSQLVHRELAGTAFLAVLAATLLSYAVARTVTRPLGAITATMREMAATGDLTRKITLLAQCALGGRGRTAARRDLQHDDRVDRPVPA